MIYGNIKNLEEYSFLPNSIQKCFEYIKNNDLENFEKGVYEIEGKDIFVNIVEYKTTTHEERFFESHKKYIDVHFILKEEEILNINFINNLEQKEFVEEDDFLPLEGNIKTDVILQKGDFLICFPSDAHMTGVKVSEPKEIKKAIFKVKI